jgi:hypothetical protein
VVHRFRKPGWEQHVQRASRAPNAGEKRRISEQILHCKWKLFWGVLRVLAELRNATPFVILNLFQDNKRPWNVILKQVQDDEAWSEEDGSTAISVMTHLSP